MYQDCMRIRTARVSGPHVHQKRAFDYGIRISYQGRTRIRTACVSGPRTYQDPTPIRTARVSGPHMDQNRTHISIVLRVGSTICNLHVNKNAL